MGLSLYAPSRHISFSQRSPAPKAQEERLLTLQPPCHVSRLWGKGWVGGGLGSSEVTWGDLLLVSLVAIELIHKGKEARSHRQNHSYGITGLFFFLI